MKHKIRFVILSLVVLAGSMTASFALADIVSGTYTSANSNNVTITRLTINEPPVSVGDFMLANISIDGGASVSVTAPAGWTLLLRTDNGTNVTLISYWKIASSSEPTSYTWSLDRQTTAKGAITPYTGVDDSDPVMSYAGNSGFGRTATTANITTTAASSTIVALYSLDDGSLFEAGHYFSTPAGMSEKYDIANIPYGPSTGQYEVVQGMAGSTGSKSSNISGTRSRNWVSQIIALRYNAPSQWVEAISDADWGPRTAHSMLNFDGKMWVISGTDGTSLNYSDDWSSTDGVTWTEESSSTPWAGRIHFASVSYDGKMWVMGGAAASGWKNDVWSSPDGINWTETTASAGWDARRGLAAVNYDGKIWVLGGDDNTGRSHDVWSSTDGITWTEVTSSAPWAGREDLTAVVYNDKMWVIGGLSNAGRMNDVWYSTDGSTWIEATSSAAWGARVDEAVVADDGGIWVIGGLNDSGALNDVWYTTDGSNWIEETSSAGWNPRYEHASVEYGDKIWVTGGSGNGGYLSDVWHN